MIKLSSLCHTIVRRAARLPQFVLALGTIVLVILALAALALPVVADQQAERRASSTPVLNYSNKAIPIGQTLSMVDPMAVPTREWGGHAISRQYYYSRQSSSPILPGVKKMPRPGEFVASPALRKLIGKDRVVAALFDDWEPSGIIGNPGLTDPHELRAILGVNANEPFLVPVSSFGNNEPIGADLGRDDTLLNRTVAGFVAIVVFFPALSLLLIVTRLSSDQRNRQVRALRFIGISKNQIRIFRGNQTAAISIPSAFVGMFLFVGGANTFTQVPFTSMGYFPDDVNVDPWVYAAAALSIGAIPALTAAASVRFESDPISPHPEPERWFAVGAASLVSGALLLAIMPLLVSAFGGRVAVTLWLGCALVAIGVALAGPSLTVRALTALIPRTRPRGGRLVGMRMSTNRDVTSLRFGSLVALLVILFLGSESFLKILDGGSQRDWEARVAAQESVPTLVTDIVGDLTLADVKRDTGSNIVVQQTSVEVDRSPMTVVLASCAQLGSLANAAPANCTDNIPQWINSSEPGGARTPWMIDLPGRDSLAAPPPSATLVAQNLPSSFTGALRLPPRMVFQPGNGFGSTFFAVIDSQDLLGSMARIASDSPTVQFDLQDLDRGNPDTQRFPDQVRWLTVGELAGLMLGVLALLAGAMGEIGERSRRMRFLRILGTPSHQMVVAHLWSSSAPLVLLGWLATSVGWLVCVAMQNVDDRASVPGGTVALVSLGVLIIGLVIGCLTWPGVRKSASMAGAIEA